MAGIGGTLMYLILDDEGRNYHLFIPAHLFSAPKGTFPPGFNLFFDKGSQDEMDWIFSGPMFAGLFEYYANLLDWENVALAEWMRFRSYVETYDQFN